MEGGRKGLLSLSLSLSSLFSTVCKLSKLGANECDRVTAIASRLTVTESLMEQSSVTTIVPV